MIKDWYLEHDPAASIRQPTVGKGKNQHDVIVVGAGPAGATAACFMAQEGLDVLVLDRAPFPGAKNCGGANIFGEHTHKLFPNFWEEVEYERIITAQAYWWMTENSAIILHYDDQKLAAAPYNRVTVKRPHLYRWLAAKGEAAGADIRFGETVKAVLFDGEQAIGVKAGEPETEYYANLIILAEGVNAILAQKAGLAPRLSAADVALYAKETIRLQPQIIEERFRLQPGQGAIIGLVGYPTMGFNGTASIHTFRDCVNVNAGMAVANYAQGGVHPNELLERIKKHPSIQPMLAGGETIEYGAAMIPEGGYNAIPPLVHPGLLIAGDTGSLVNGTHGFSLAMWSGYFAAKAAVLAKRKRDFSVKRLSLYRTLLDESFIMQDLRANAGAARLQTEVPYLFDLYTRMANQGAYLSARLVTMPKREKRKWIFRKVTSMQPVLSILRDAWKVAKVVR